MRKRSTTPRREWIPAAEMETPLGPVQVPGGWADEELRRVVQRMTEADRVRWTSIGLVVRMTPPLKIPLRIKRKARNMLEVRDFLKALPDERRRQTEKARKTKVDNLERADIALSRTVKKLRDRGLSASGTVRYLASQDPPIVVGWKKISRLRSE